MICTLGIDFGTESVRVLLVDVANGTVIDEQSRSYQHGVLDRELPNGIKLPADHAFQHPQDWLEDSFTACRALVKRNAKLRDSIIGIGVDFTSCTMLPCKSDGTPLCLVKGFRASCSPGPSSGSTTVPRPRPTASTRSPPPAKRSGSRDMAASSGSNGSSPRCWRHCRRTPKVYAAAEVWIEAGDWFVWQLTDGIYPATDPRRSHPLHLPGRLQGLWSEEDGYPSSAFFAAVHRGFKNFVQDKMPGAASPPGMSAGDAIRSGRRAMGLPAGLPVSAGDHRRPRRRSRRGRRVAFEMVLVIGTSSCHMMNHPREQLVPGVAGVVEDGILPGYFGYESGQACVGDAFAWLAKTTGLSHESSIATGLSCRRVPAACWPWTGSTAAARR